MTRAGGGEHYDRTVFSKPIRSIIVLGGGSAGLLAALTLKTRLPHLAVQLVRSPEIGTIGVGEGTTIAFPEHLFDYLGLARAGFHAHAEPTWKLGLRMLWGPRDRFFYVFNDQFDARVTQLSRGHGYYCEDSCDDTNLAAALAARDRLFPDRGDGWPQFLEGGYGYHIENQKLISYLEIACSTIKIPLSEGTVIAAEKGPAGIDALRLESGESVTGDLFIDASGFRAELIGRALGGQWRGFERALFTDRAVIGGWARGEEPILPYTTAETMPAGWAWQIEHERFINRGYVYSSAQVSDDEAQAEFLRANPKIGETRVVKFRSGRWQNAWVGNVVAVGNASGFVEPLEATALSQLAHELRHLADMLADAQDQPSASMMALYNRKMAETWEAIRDFLALHYRFNTRLETPFWQRCRAETDLGHLDEFIHFYQENGPTGFARQLLPAGSDAFHLSGYLALLLGMKVPYAGGGKIDDAEKATWQRFCQRHGNRAMKSLTVRQCLEAVRHPAWQWP